MAFTRLSYDRDWTNGTDFPTYQDSEEQVRADLQYHPNAIRDFINKMLAEMEGKAAAESIGALQDNNPSTVQQVLDGFADDLMQLAEDIKTTASGGVPSVVKSNTVSFTDDSWVSAGSGYTLTIPRSDHGRDNEGFGYSIYQQVNGTYKSGTWGAAATRVAYNAGNIVMTTDEPYGGKIVFYGA